MSCHVRKISYGGATLYSPHSQHTYRTPHIRGLLQTRHTPVPTGQFIRSVPFRTATPMTSQVEFHHEPSCAIKHDRSESFKDNGLNIERRMPTTSLYIYPLLVE